MWIVMGCLLAAGIVTVEAQDTATPPLTAPAAPVPRSTERTAPPVASSSDHRLSAGDSIEISVFQEPDLSARVTLSKEGKVSLPLINEISLSGLTSVEASQALVQRYRQGYLKNPKITVIITDFAKQRFTILGAINKPGSYYFPTGETLSLLQAIGMGGGYTRAANASNVTVKRRQGARPIKVDAKRMAKQGETSPFFLQQGDIITVAESIF
jgi:polysaccharide export outer membrane protein